jgi:4,5-dihydroxyphthalate decarboxylase
MLEASICLSDNPRTRAILDGRVKIDGLHLLPTSVHPSEMFWRQLRYGDFDISEMSLATMFIAASKGDLTWAAIPVYTTRRFFHTWIMVRRGADIRTPQDLRGRKVGVPEYQQTSAVWSRGVLQEFFGVRPSEIEWFMERGAERSHGHATGFTAPKGVTVHMIPPAKDIGAMLASGELDATLLYLNSPNLVDRARLAVEDVAVPLFPDPTAESRRFYAETGLYPINHAVVVRRSLLERHPWIALNVYNAFIAARQRLRDDVRSFLQAAIDTGRIDASAVSRVEEDQMPYGLAAARPELERIALYLEEQGLAERRIDPAEVFAPSTLDL